MITVLLVAGTRQLSNMEFIEDLQSIEEFKPYSTSKITSSSKSNSSEIGEETIKGVTG